LRGVAVVENKRESSGFFELSWAFCEFVVNFEVRGRTVSEVPTRSLRALVTS
jgi:hypothetical protein